MSTAFSDKFFNILENQICRWKKFLKFKDKKSLENVKRKNEPKTSKNKRTYQTETIRHNCILQPDSAYQRQSIKQWFCLLIRDVKECFLLKSKSSWFPNPLIQHCA